MKIPRYYADLAGGKLFGYELKWANRRHKAPREWSETYPEASFGVINRDNYLELLT